MSVRALRDELIVPTLAHAVENSPFYAARFGDRWRKVRRVADLARLPILTKDEAVDGQDAMRCGLPQADFGTVSSGTTRVGDRVFRVERCPEEDEALAELFGAGDDDGDGDEDPLVLHVLTPNHGLPAGAAPRGTLRLAWSPSKNVADMILAALAATYGGRRITVMRASISVVKQLTVWFLDKGVDPTTFGVRDIGTNAALVTTRWREIVRRTWNARIHDNYSISEFKTPATEDDDGWYRFTDPPLIPEVVDPHDGAPVQNGVGHLVLTGLFPFVQRTPLIRYATGDLVQVRDEGDDVAIKFVGRVAQTPRVVEGGASHYLLFPAIVEDVVDDHAEVARHVHPFEIVQKLPHARVGQPKVRVALDGDTVRVVVGTDFDPRLFPQRASALAFDVHAALLARHPPLAARLARGQSALVVEPLLARGDDDWNRWFVKYLA